MNLASLKAEIEKTIECVKEDGRDPVDVMVAVQVDNAAGKSVWSLDVDVLYDNDCNVSDCVIFGFIGD
jgi:hypothetical protein